MEQGRVEGAKQRLIRGKTPRTVRRVASLGIMLAYFGMGGPRGQNHGSSMTSATRLSLQLVCLLLWVFLEETSSYSSPELQEQVRQTAKP